jgi:tetratricopeptide (TPR) repeat protein
LSAVTEHEEKVQDPMGMFLYALRAPETRRQYPRRLKVFLDYLKLEGPIEQQAIEFLSKAKQNVQWAQNSLMQFITFQKERAKNGEISYLTIGNYYKATKLFIEMNTDTPIINWKKITRGIMVLDVSMRGRLEKKFDKAINRIPSFIDTFHKPEVKSKLHITNEEDFILGWSYGYIIDNFSNDFVSTKSRLANTEELKEAYDILFKRTAEIREVIFKGG